MRKDSVFSIAYWIFMSMTGAKIKKDFKFRQEFWTKKIENGSK